MAAQQRSPVAVDHRPLIDYFHQTGGLALCLAVVGVQQLWQALTSGAVGRPTPPTPKERPRKTNALTI